MNPAESPLVTVIIPNWNGRKFLPTCLNSLRAQTFRRFAVLLIDNGSQDDSLPLVRTSFPEVRVISLDRNFGFSEAVNRGILASATPWVALLNNDTEADPSWLQAAINAFHAFPEADYLACRMMNYFRRDLLDSAGDYLTRSGLPLKRGMDQPASGEWLQGCFVMGASAGAAIYRRSCFQKVGLFDNGYFLYLEDVDWCLRAALMGLHCFYVPEAVVYHIEGGSDPQRQGFLDRGQSTRKSFHTPQRTYWITRNRIRLLTRNIPALLLLKHLMGILYGFGRSTLFHLFKSGLFGSYLRGLLHGLGDIWGCLPERRRIQKQKAIKLGEFDRICFHS